jgi:hypothetical protein
MESLPCELRDEILRHLSSSCDLKAVRLLNRNCHDVATPRLFRRVFLTVRKESFENLNRICDSKLSEHVRCLHYNIWEAPLILQREWIQAVDRMRRGHKGGHREQLPRYEDYHQYFQGQTLHNECDILAKAFQRLPRLRSVEISERLPEQFNKTGGSSFCLNRILDMAARCQQYIPNDLASGPSGKISRTLITISTHGEVNHGSLETLSLEHFRWHWLDMRDVRMWHEPSMLNQALKGLRSMRISVPKPDLDDEDADMPDPDATRGVWMALIGLPEHLMDVEVSVQDAVCM